MRFNKKLFSLKKYKYHCKLTIFGVSINYISPKLISKVTTSLENNIRPDLMNFGPRYIWQNEEKFTYKMKKWFLSNLFYERVGYYPNLKTPKSFNEKLNWMKLHYDNPVQRRCVDKCEFKSYIKEELGDGYTIPMIGVYEDVDDIDFDKLPEKFVVKSTLQGAGTFMKIVTDKSKLDINKVKYELNNYLQDWNTSYYTILARAYKGLKPRIIIEEYMPIRENEALEYKFFCYHGEMKFCIVEMDYFGKNPQRAFYDKDFQEVPFRINNHLKKSRLEEKPVKYDEMVTLAEKLSKVFPFVRVDFYVVEDKLYVGEFTFTSGGGFSIFDPLEWDYKVGEWLDLEKLESEYLINNKTID